MESNPPPPPPPSSSSSSSSLSLSASDYKTLSLLHSNYQTVLQKKQFEAQAQLRSLRQTTAGAVGFLVLLLTVFTYAVGQMAPDNSVAQSMLFSFYTVTSAGFGSVPVPNTVSFLLFATLYVYLGISALAINVAQLYQYLETEHQRWLHRQQKAQLTRDGLQQLLILETNKDEDDLTSSDPNPVDSRIRQGLGWALQQQQQREEDDEVDKPSSSSKQGWWWCWPSVRVRGACRRCLPWQLVGLLVMVTLLLIVAIGMMALEPAGWSFVEALYFATFAMTTVGYGDLYPTTNASTWFVVSWLLFNVPFMAIFFSLVAHYYVRFSRWKEQQLIQSMSQQQQQKLGGNQTTTAATNNETHQQRRPSPPVRRWSRLLPTQRMMGRRRTSSSVKVKVVPMLADAPRDDLIGTHSVGGYDNFTNYKSSIREEGISSSGSGTPSNIPSNNSWIKYSMRLRHKESSSGSGTNASPTPVVVAPQEFSSTTSSSADITSLPAAKQVLQELFQQQQDEHDSNRRHAHSSAGISGRAHVPVTSYSTLEEPTATAAPTAARRTLGEESSSQLDVFLDDVVTVRELLHRLKHPGLVPAAAPTRQLEVHFTAVERVARIVVSLVGLPTQMEINNNEISLTIESLKEVVTKWMIPFAARTAFRIAVFRTILFVGEDKLTSRGMDAILDLDPFHINDIIGSVVLAMENSAEEWLAATLPLVSELDSCAVTASRTSERRSLKNQIEDYFPANPGNAVLTRM